jgi:cell wall-associated NlpC family hydrolase
MQQKNIIWGYFLKNTPYSPFLRFVVALVMVTISIASFAQQKTNSLANPTDTLSLSQTRVDSIVLFARQQLGKPYRYAHNGPDQFDCSGFVYYVFTHFNMQLPRASVAYADIGKTVSIYECRKGDIILFTGTETGSREIGHIGIVVSDFGQPLQFIHASSSEKHPGVVITDYVNSAYPQRFVKIVRVLD